MYGRRPQLGGPFPNGTPIPESQITFRNPESGKVGAYHGSPHKFEAFSMEKVGTGEGAQAYGHGLYFAENPNVAKSYRASGVAEVTLGGKTISNPKLVTHDIALAHIEEAMDRGSTNPLRDAQKSIQTMIGSIGREAADHPNFEAAIDVLQDWQARGAKLNPNRGAMYHVEIDAEPHQFLDWDKPLSEQSPQLQRALGDVLGPSGKVTARDGLQLAGGGVLRVVEDPDFGTRYFMEIGGKTFKLAARDIPNLLGQGTEGRAIYQQLSTTLGGDAAASKYLAERGVKGIRYLDQGSRGTGQGTSNYVVFDDKLVKIINREGFSGAKVLGPLAAALAAGSLGAKALNARKRGILP